MYRSAVPYRLLFVCLFSLASWCTAQAASWHLFPYAATYRSIEVMGSYVYVLKDNTLLRTPLNDLSTLTPFDHYQGLENGTITAMCYSVDDERLCLAYDDGLLALITPEGKVSYVTDYRDNPFAGRDKTICHIHASKGLLYVATGFGFFVVDLNTGTVVEAFDLGTTVCAAWQYDGHWYYSTANGTYGADVALSAHDPRAWTQISTLSINQVILLEVGGSPQCWLHATNDALIYQIKGNTALWFSTLNNVVTRIHRAGRYIMALQNGQLTLYDTTFGHPPSLNETPKNKQRLFCSLSSPYKTAVDAAAYPDDDTALFLLFPTSGALSIRVGSVSSQRFTPSLLYNGSYLGFTSQPYQANNTLMGVSRTGLITLANTHRSLLHYVDMISEAGYLTQCTVDTVAWTHIPAASITQNMSTGQRRFVGVTSMAIDPTQDNRLAFGTLEDGIVVVKNGAFSARYNASEGATKLTSNGGTTRVEGVAYSKQGDLWAFNSGVDKALTVRTASGIWANFSVPELAKQYGFSHLCFTHCGNRHQLWGVQDFRYQSSTVFVYDCGTYAASATDDKVVTFKKLQPVTQAGGTPTGATFIPYYGLGVAESPSGEIWLLNSSGLYVVDQPDSVFAHPGEVRTVLADGLVPISIAFDAQQHIYVGTQANGLYVLGDQGHTTLAHYTKENSLLPANEVLSLTYDTLRTTLWIGTNGSVTTCRFSADDFATSTKETVSVVPTAYCFPNTVVKGKETAVHVFGVKEGTTVSLWSATGVTTPHTSMKAQAGIATCSIDGLPAGTYVLVGTDKNGYSGTLASLVITDE